MILQVFIFISTWVVSTQAREVAESLGRISEYLKTRFHLAVLWRRKLQAFQRSRSFRQLVFPLQPSFHILHPPHLNLPIRESLQCCSRWWWFGGKCHVLPLQRTTSRVVSYCFSLGSSLCQKSKTAFPAFPLLPRQRGRSFSFLFLWTTPKRISCELHLRKDLWRSQIYYLVSWL